MKGTKYICLSMLVCFILSGCCRKHEPDPEFVTGDEIVLKIDGAVKVKSGEETVPRARGQYDQVLYPDLL